MLNPEEIERLFIEAKTPEAGRRLIRDIVANAPVRELQSRTDTVRTRYISKKMGQAFIAESRTVELPAFVWYDHDKAVSHYLAQPCKLDLSVSGLKGGRTRIQHTPDAFVIRDGHFYLEEWRTEDRLERLAQDRPHHFSKDDQGVWHYLPAEEHCAALGITHRLRSANELPRVFIDNMRFLADYSLESAPPVPESVVNELLALLDTHKRMSHLQLVYEFNFKADHIFALVLDGRVYVDLHTVRCDDAASLVIYANELVSKADAVLKAAQRSQAPKCVLELRAGARFVYDGRAYEVLLPGLTDVVVKDSEGRATTLPMDLMRQLHEKGLLDAGDGTPTPPEYDLAEIVANEMNLRAAMRRIEALNNPEASDVPPRTLRRWQREARGLVDPVQRLKKLMPRRGGNTKPRLPQATVDLVKEVRSFHNRAASPTKQATYQAYLGVCEAKGITPMSKTTFYKRIREHEDIKKREGRRKAYQKAAIPLTHDYDHPVHGVLPHEVAYCDHTIVNQLTKGQRMDNLGKPTMTLITDGAVSTTRAMVLLYRPASTVSVLMALRDYARRWGCLPRVLVLDNGKEFHSDMLEAVCELFGMEIRWRRRSKPRDSTLVERAIGVTEQELLSALDGNTIALKNPREVSKEVKPENFITWTLPALHGALDHFLFTVHAGRIHPRFGVTPNEWEKRLMLEFGERAHRMVRFDSLFKLLTSAPPDASRTARKLDRRKGVFVNGMFYWNDRFRTSTKREETVDVRVEIWNASVVYVLFDGNWLVAQARDGRRVEGRFSYELETLRRRENELRKSSASKDKQTVRHALEKLKAFDRLLWDDLLREQCVEEHRLYARLGMVEALPGGVNAFAAELDLGLRRGSDLPLIEAMEPEVPSASPQEDAALEWSETGDETPREPAVAVAIDDADDAIF